MVVEMFHLGVKGILDQGIDTVTAQVGAIAGNAANATNLNYVIIGLVVIIVILIVITLFGNRK